MDVGSATPLLGGLSAVEFMRRHWQKKPLLVRGALADALPHIDARSLFALAARDDVESRLVTCHGERWTLRQGPMSRRSLPPQSRAGWTLLVQGVDLHDAAVHRLLERFRFVPDARLDDAMLSYASDGGGVGPHIDSYDVFLLQVSGRRRWRAGRVRRPRLRDDVPLKMLADFEPTQDWLLDPGDMLYLPPGWGHDGVAVGPCITCSIGFRAPGEGALAAATLQRIADALEDEIAERAGAAGTLYADASQEATQHPARIPAALEQFAAHAIERVLADPDARRLALGEILSEPKPGVWFDANRRASDVSAVALDRRSRMLYDDRHVFINGEAFRSSGSDARLMRRLADRRRLTGADVARLSQEARSLLDRWLEAGWCVGDDDPAGDPPTQRHIPKEQP